MPFVGHTYAESATDGTPTSAPKVPSSVIAAGAILLMVLLLCLIFGSWRGSWVGRLRPMVIDARARMGMISVQDMRLVQYVFPGLLRRAPHAPPTEAQANRPSGPPPLGRRLPAQAGNVSVPNEASAAERAGGAEDGRISPSSTTCS